MFSQSYPIVTNRCYSYLALFSFLFLTPLQRLDAHEQGNDSQEANSVTSNTDEEVTVASGVVFEDLNRDGVLNPGEPGLAGMRVSNGREIVKTDAQGRYRISITEDTIIFVIKSRGWSTLRNQEHLPQFYYIHKPNGSPADFRYAGVKPTGPLPDSVDFGLHRNDEPDSFKAILFGDPQPSNLSQVEYIAHDVIEQIVSEEGHDASFGVTLGDIVFDDLAIMEPLNQAIALIGIPWYNVIGNHDLNTDAPSDKLSDETFERIYGPSYYSFDYGAAHFLVIDNVEWHGATDGKRGHYHGGIGEEQLAFIRNDLALIPDDQLVVLMMHIPLTSVVDRQSLYRLIEKRPATVSIAAHTHNMEHRFIGEEDGWQGVERHHHIVNVTVGGSWWRGQKDERGIPHATMSDGGPNGYSIMEFDGASYSLKFRGAGEPSHYQMSINSPEHVSAESSSRTEVTVNVFNGSEKSKVRMRVRGMKAWVPMERVRMADPNFVANKAREDAIADKKWTPLPGPHKTPHIWKGLLADGLSVGTHLIEVEADLGRDTVRGKRVIRITP